MNPARPCRRAGSRALWSFSALTVLCAALCATSLAQGQAGQVPRHDSASAIESIAAALSLSGSVESESAAPLRLSTVLEAVERSHPKLEAAARKLEASRAKQEAAQGVWDPYIALEGKRTPVGYYQHSEVDASVQQATPLWGLRLYGGYRRGVGEYPVYKGELETLSGGEVRAGAELPLWKGGPVDAARAEVARRSALASTARCGRDVALLQVRRYAARAYWKWVLSGQNVRIQFELLQVAKQRDAAIRDRVALGSAAAISITDNGRILLEREAKFVTAQQQFDAAAVDLSLFYRDDALQPVVVDETRVPHRVPVMTDMPASDLAADLKLALSQRPELCELLGARDAAAVLLRLADNQRAPFIALQAQVARDMGEGPASLAGTELSIGVKIAMPLTLRKARGQLRAADAELSALQAQLRGLSDQVAAEIRQSRIGLDAARRKLDLARQQLEAARALADAERQKLIEGASDLVIVNLREVAVAEAARMVAESLVALQLSRVDYRTALGAAW